MTSSYRAVAEQLVKMAMDGDDRGFQEIARRLEMADRWQAAQREIESLQTKLAGARMVHNQQQQEIEKLRILLYDTRGTDANVE